ncbi:559_t:CDS:2 [Funneliformis caledonium]|uniref:559_t:CDS:1 n=1 Tax=Funneliformis caledonium TaxID=1117310 RepID=A0A9N9GNM9_9GLOM|nr:559_t:CDS:2 [Funneliformis caledonium]
MEHPNVTTSYESTIKIVQLSAKLITAWLDDPEAFTLGKSLDYLMKDGSPEAKYYATLLDKKIRTSIVLSMALKNGLEHSLRLGEKSMNCLFDDLCTHYS